MAIKSDNHHVLVYMEDAVKQLLEHREENFKVNPTKFFSDYFISVREGNHVMFREFAFVESTPHNRVSFVRTFWKCFRNIGRKGDLLSIREYHSLVCLLCADFPFKIIQKTARIILMDDAMDCLISFTDFLYAFQVQFCYDEFLTKCADTYKGILQNPQTNHETVIVPTSQESPSPPTSSAQVTTSNVEGIDAMHFYRALVPVTCPLSILKDILSAVERVTFYGFLMALAKSDALNKSIGRLPHKTNLLDIPDQDLTTNSQTQDAGNKNQRSAPAQPSVPPIRPSSSRAKQNSSRPLSSNTNSQPQNAHETVTRQPTPVSVGALESRPPSGRQPRKVRRQVSSTDDSSSDTTVN